MKKCSYCGAEYSDDTAACTIDQTPLDSAGSPAGDREFAPLAEADRQAAWVTVVRCRTLVDADQVATMLRSLEIETFLPDELLMQTMGWTLHTYGYVRVQVTPQDYEAAKNLLAAASPGS